MFNFWVLFCVPLQTSLWPSISISDRREGRRRCRSFCHHLKFQLILNSSIRSRKGLLNMATFAAPTRWIVSGLELEHDIVEGRIDICHAYNIEVSLESLLDRTDEHVEYLRHFDKSPILLFGDLDWRRKWWHWTWLRKLGGGKCFHLLRLAQLATLGYLVSVLPVAFAASYPNTREALCTESFQKSSPLQQCDCELDSEGTMKEILIDEVKKSAKVALLMKEIDRRFTGCYSTITIP